MPANQKVCLWHFDVNEVDEWMKNNDSENISDAKQFLNKNKQIAYGYQKRRKTCLKLNGMFKIMALF